MSLLNFFWRDFKSDKSFNWFAILCAALGIIGLLLVESFKGGIEEKIGKNAKNFIAADLSISSRRALQEQETKLIEDYINSHQIKYARWIETYSLVSKVNSINGTAKLSDLNFVSDEFPFYGGVKLSNLGFMGPGKWEILHKAPTAWINRDLFWELDLKIGDKIKVGNIDFVVAGIIEEDKFSSFRGFNLAPKIFLSTHFLAQTGLIKFGSTASYAYALKLDQQSDQLKIKKELRILIPDKSIKIIGPLEASQQVSQSLNILSDYLGLITLMTYLLSLVGLYYFTQRFLSKRLKTLSIYKSLGVKTSFLFGINILHLFVIVLSSVLLSTSFVVASLPFLKLLFTRLIGEEIFFKLGFVSILKILILSLGGSLGALAPLIWGALQTPIATVFQDLPDELKRIKFYYFLPLVIYIIFLTIFLANSFKVGSAFLLSLVLIVSLAGIAFKLFALILEKISHRLNFTNRHAAKTLSRYFTSSFTIFICLTIGLSLSVFIFQLDSSLRHEFTQTYGDKRPDLFMFDLQDEQYENFNRVMIQEKWHQTLIAPMVRGRLVKINDELTQKRPSVVDEKFETREDQNSEQIRNRGVNLSYRSKLSWAERIVEGQFNGAKFNGEIEKHHSEISLEQTYAKRLGVKLGDLLTFDISGVEITGVISSLRKVKWMSFEPNFFILFQPGVLDDAPKTYLSSFKINSNESKKDFFVKMAKLFPNVSLIDVVEVVKKIITVFDLMAIAIKFISLLSLFVALVVLMAVSFNHLDLRKREMTLFYMMGVKLSVIKKIYAQEFIILIVPCLILSLIFGSSLCILLMKYVFDSEALLRLPFVISIIFLIGIFLYSLVVLRIRQLVKKNSLF